MNFRVVQLQIHTPVWMELKRIEFRKQQFTYLWFRLNNIDLFVKH